MKQATQFIMLTLAILLATGGVTSGGAAEADASRASLGRKEWPPVTNGLVFVDGKYIHPPYTVFSVEGDIFINGTPVMTALKWPPQVPPTVPPPQTEPTLPSTITQETTEYDLHLIGYIADTKRFLIHQYGREKGLSKMVDVYRALPCIKTAEIDGEDSNNLKVVWIDGRIHNITQLPQESLDSTITRDQAIRHVDRIATIYVNGLGKNLYFIIGGGTRMGTHGGFIQTFTPLANAMRTAKDEEDYLSIMKTNQPPGGMSEKTLRLFYRYKDDLPKWDPQKRAVDNPATPATQ